MTSTSSPVIARRRSRSRSPLPQDAADTLAETSHTDAKRPRLDAGNDPEEEQPQQSPPSIVNIPASLPAARTINRRPDMYRNRLILAPMVRTGELPFRLTSLTYGASLVYSPEYIDKALAGCERVECDRSPGMVRFRRGPRDIFCVHPSERGRLVLQLGSSDPKYALEAAKLCEADVDAFDLNCGCPKPFSTHAGMGAALLSTPDLLCSILTALIEGTSRPVSAKIRLLPTKEETLSLVRRICETGVSALAVHCRSRNQRYDVKARWEELRDISKICDEYDVPLIANGDVYSPHKDLELLREYGVSSVMAARSAQSNPSVFRPEGPLKIEEAMRQFMHHLLECRGRYENGKFVLGGMISGKKPYRDLIQRIHKSRSLRDLALAFDMLDVYEQYPDFAGTDGDRDTNRQDDLCPYVPVVDLPAEVVAKEEQEQPER